MCVCDSSFISCIPACEVSVFGGFASIAWVRNKPGNSACSSTGPTRSVPWLAGRWHGMMDAMERTDFGDLEQSSAGP
eukprot:Skav229142  [mRNA]  locus=scaffold1875:164693:165255:- [translate_table: standard]